MTAACLFIYLYTSYRLLLGLFRGQSGNPMDQSKHLLNTRYESKHIEHATDMSSTVLGQTSNAVRLKKKEKEDRYGILSQLN